VPSKLIFETGISSPFRCIIGSIMDFAKSEASSAISLGGTKDSPIEEGIFTSSRAAEAASTASQFIFTIDSPFLLKVFLMAFLTSSIA